MGSSERAPRAVIGIDMGTTAVKVQALAVGTARGPATAAQPLATAAREYPLEHPQPGWEVQDSDAMVRAALDAVAECHQRIGQARVIAIGLSTAMHGLVGLDAQNHPVTPLLTWADTRAGGEAEALRAGRVASARRSGTPVHAMAPLAKIRWFCDHEAATARRVSHWAGLKDVLVLALTGQLVTELSSASGTGMLDLARRDWDAELVTLAGAHPDQLPPIRRTIDHLPLGDKGAAHTGVPAGTPVVLGAGDGPLGNLGTGAIEPGVASLSLGTSGAVRMLVPQPSTEGDESLFCYALTDQCWAIGGAISNGGMVARWAEQTYLADHEAYSRDDALAELAASAPPGSDGLVMVPYLVGERAPLWDPAIPGALLGLRREHTAAHMARAAIEGVALQLSVLLDHLESVQPVRQVRATGGVFRSQLWRDVVAAATNRPMVVTDAAGGSGLGAAALALVGIGQVESFAEALALLGSPPDVGELVRVDDSLAHALRAARNSVSPMLDALRPVGQVMATDAPTQGGR